MTNSFEHRTQVRAPADVVFDLALDVAVHLQSQERSRERAVGGVTSGTIGLGEQVTWRAVHFGIPFRRFHHEHCFEQDEGETTMIDRIDFDAPLGPVGRVVEGIVLAGLLRKLIEQRGAFLKRVAENRA
ncbi:MAG TPA: SRPBCC family protein [Acidimicrobiales bacterium]|nr:SRPBCC family protein [Acidimicrobiales bacterium]